MASTNSTTLDRITESEAGGLWSDVWRRFRRNPIALTGFYVVCIFVFMALFADFIANDKPYYTQYKGKSYFPIFRSYWVGMKLGKWPAELLNVEFTKLEGARSIFPPIPYRPSNIHLLEPLEPPSRRHWFGTDKLGRDVMAGMIHGSRISLSIGFVAVGIAVVIGVILGAVAGYFGAWVDLVISRLFEVMLSIPTFFLLITISSYSFSFFLSLVISLPGFASGFFSLCCAIDAYPQSRSANDALNMYFFIPGILLGFKLRWSSYFKYRGVFGNTKYFGNVKLWRLGDVFLMALNQFLHRPDYLV